jgi:hypothetical protein
VYKKEVVNEAKFTSMEKERADEMEVEKKKDEKKKKGA